MIRSYSPVPRSRPLNDDDNQEAYVTRMIELGNDFDDCLDFMKDLCYFVKDGEDVTLMNDIKGITSQAIDEHLEVMEEGGKQLFSLNYEMDKVIRDMMEFQKEMGIEPDSYD